MATLSIVVPCYNEEATVGELLRRVCVADLGGHQMEVIVVDDGSSDRTVELVERFRAGHPKVQLLIQPCNMGKGAAVRRGLKQAQGDLVVVQDADLEYDPRDFRQMLELFRLPQVAVVFGSRRLLPDHRGSGYFYYWGAQGINLITNLLYGVRISDQFTCYKMMRRSLLTRVSLCSDGFAVDAELVAKLLRLKARIFEVPVTYHPRTRAQGKKIRTSDGLQWFWQIVKYRFLPYRWW